jgi:uncharacterized SAM-binding protein YcdF (DUF218 family)
MSGKGPILKPAFWTLALAALLAAGCSKLISAPLLLPEKPLHPADAIVVLGSGPPVDKEGRPTAELTRRVEKGVELYRQGLAPVLIMTGGNTYRDYYESEVMKQVAVAKGVPAQAVLEERKSLNTIGNARYSAALVRARGGKSVIIVSSPFHLKRAKKLFEATGLEIQTAGCKVPDSARYAISFSIYEYLARVKYLFIDEEALVRGGEKNARTTPLKAPAPMPAGAAP